MGRKLGEGLKGRGWIPFNDVAYQRVRGAPIRQPRANITLARGYASRGSTYPFCKLEGRNELRSRVSPLWGKGTHAVSLGLRWPFATGVNPDGET